MKSTSGTDKPSRPSMRSMEYCAKLRVKEKNNLYKTHRQCEETCWFRSIRSLTQSKGLVRETSTHHKFTNEKILLTSLVLFALREKYIRVKIYWLSTSTNWWRNTSQDIQTPRLQSTFPLGSPPVTEHSNHVFHKTFFYNGTFHTFSC